MKTLIRTMVRRMGYDIKNLSGIPAIEVPGWMKVDAPEPEDEMVPGPWVTNVLEMVTHAHRPERLAYHHRSYGEDHRLKYLMFYLDVRGLRVLETGPLEGYWSILLEKMGVRETVAIELRPENLAKCERIKQLHGLDHTVFLEQNLEALCDGREAPRYEGTFDLVFCQGLLYHLPDPARALRWFRTQAPRLFLGTVYVEPAEAGRYLPELLRHDEYRHEGKVYRGMTYREGGWSDPLSGASATSFWPYESDLVAMMRDAGYARVEIVGKDLVNRMPYITLAAE